MLGRARAERDSRLQRVTSWTDFLAALDAKSMALAPHCNSTTCEEQIKHKSGEVAKAQFAEEERQAKIRAAEAKANGGDADEEEAALGEKLTGAAKSLCIPFDQPQLPAGQTCVHCTQPAVHYTLFGRSY
jgi:prolyl-tRNA synthetase